MPTRHLNAGLPPGHRGVRLADRPSLSVVVASVKDPLILDYCLERLLPVCTKHSAELIVVRSCGLPELSRLEHVYPEVRFVGVAPGPTEGELRSIGVGRSIGDVIALTSDDPHAVDRCVAALARVARRAESGAQDASSIQAVGAGPQRSSWAPQVRQPELWAFGRTEEQRKRPPRPPPQVQAPRLASRAPFLSVIVAAHQCAAVLERSLRALSESELPRETWELIVVDDASTDETSLIAALHADLLVSLAGESRGAAYARNRGAELSRGDVLVFVDPAVGAEPDALPRISAAFAEDPQLGAIFGSYGYMQAGGLLGRYRSLLHLYAHDTRAGEAETFWAGCGAVRRGAFLGVGMFDEWHHWRSAIEDLELGRRLRHAGERIRFDPEIQARRLQPWLPGSVTRDFWRRGIPWWWLTIQEARHQSFTPRLGATNRFLASMAALTLLPLLLGVSLGSPVLAGVALLPVATVLWTGRWFSTLLRRRYGARVALLAMPLLVVYAMTMLLSAGTARVMGALFGEPTPPPDVEARASLGVKTWPPTPAPRASVWSRVAETREPVQATTGDG